MTTDYDERNQRRDRVRRGYSYYDEVTPEHTQAAVAANRRKKDNPPTEIDWDAALASFTQMMAEIYSDE